MIRSMLMSALALAAFAGTAAASPGATTNTGGGFTCVNKLSIQVVECVGTISVLPIKVTVKDVRALNNNELNVLSDDLNHVSILDGDILDYNKILNDAEVSVFEDFLNKFDIDVTKNDVDVCTTILGGLFCK